MMTRLAVVFGVSSILAAACSGAEDVGLPDHPPSDAGGAAGTGSASGGAACRAGGVPCEAYTDCCSLTCSNQICTDCQAEGEACTAVGCCGGLPCKDGVCTSKCNGGGVQCTTAAECCSNVCSAGYCGAPASSCKAEPGDSACIACTRLDCCDELQRCETDSVCSCHLYCQKKSTPEDFVGCLVDEGCDVSGSCSVQDPFCVEPVDAFKHCQERYCPGECGSGG
jgi:hypothetical protein